VRLIQSLCAVCGSNLAGLTLLFIVLPCVADVSIVNCAVCQQFNKRTLLLLLLLLYRRALCLSVEHFGRLTETAVRLRSGNDYDCTESSAWSYSLSRRIRTTSFMVCTCRCRDAREKNDEWKEGAERGSICAGRWREVKSASAAAWYLII